MSLIVNTYTQEPGLGWTMLDSFFSQIIRLLRTLGACKAAVYHPRLSSHSVTIPLEEVTVAPSRASLPAAIGLRASTPRWQWPGVVEPEQGPLRQCLAQERGLRRLSRGLKHGWEPARLKPPGSATSSQHVPGQAPSPLGSRFTLTFQGLLAADASYMVLCMEA